MKRSLLFFFTAFVFLSQPAVAQNDTASQRSAIHTLTLEPGIGLHPYPLSDFLITNLAQYDLRKHFAVVAHSAYSRNDAFLRDFNYIKTEYNFTLAQRVGIGATFHTKRGEQGFSLMAGVKYDAYKETLHNPELENVSVSVGSWSPDFGLMYQLKWGQKKYFFSYRMYLPLYPYPFSSFDINTVDANIASISMECGLGIRLK